MISLVQNFPTRIEVECSHEELIQLRTILTYKDREIEQAIKILKKNRIRYGESYVSGRIAALEPQLYKTMLTEDSTGCYFLSGLLDTVISKFNPDQVTFTNNIQLPEFKLIPWAKKPPYDPLPYQVTALERMLANPHCHIEAATGVGKSFIAILLAKATGLPTIITTPSVGIARALYDEAKLYFGKGKVGLFGNGKDEVGAHILIAVGKSVSMVKESDRIADFAKYQVLISDESHTLPANQFEYAINTVLAHCPYRWFLSATQERNDGRDLLLEGIIGRREFTYTIQKAIEQGYLAKLSFLVFDVDSRSDYRSDMIVKMNQEHIYKNEEIAQAVADMAGQAVNAGMPTLILVDEHIQEQILRAYMRVNYEYAEGKSDTNDIVKRFNAGKVMCVIGTSAISTGTNFKPVRLTINWCANKAGTKVKQGPIGRSTRLDKETNKTDCRIVDFRIANVPMLKRHGNIRMEYYAEVGPVTVARL